MLYLFEAKVRVFDENFPLYYLCSFSVKLCTYLGLSLAIIYGSGNSFSKCLSQAISLNRFFNGRAGYSGALAVLERGIASEAVHIKRTLPRSRDVVLLIVKCQAA